MANIQYRLPQNATGPFFVDDTCIDCDICRSEFPDFFARHHDTGFSFVHRQPQTEAEYLACQSAVESCPSDSIGRDDPRRD